MNPDSKDTDTAMHDYNIIGATTAEPMRTRTYVDRRAGTTSPDNTRSRVAKAQSVALRKARRNSRKGDR